MRRKSIERIAVVIPNLNGEAYLQSAIDSLLKQDCSLDIIVVDNASSDRSIAILEEYGDAIRLLKNTQNLGFAGGVNVGISYAIEHNFDAIALFNNDAVAQPNWLSQLADAMKRHDDTGIVTCRIQLEGDNLLDSTGEFYTSWGLPYPRGREQPIDSYADEEYIFGASGGASLYRTELLHEIGVFDEAYFAYYEDTDISFRAQLAGWKVLYTPGAVVNHRQGATAKKMVRGFTVYQMFKNLPMLFIKNVPARLLVPIGIRFYFAYGLIFANAVIRGHGWPALKGMVRHWSLLAHCLSQRWRIQRTKKADADYIRSIIIHDLPPNQTGIRKLRKLFLHK